MEELDGFIVGQWYVVKSGNFKGMNVKINKLYIAQFANMKAPKPYADVTFPAKNGWTFQLARLKKVGE